MKILFYTLAFLIGCIPVFSQVPTWAWAKRAGDVGYDQCEAIATDSKGNVYITGEFQSKEITFGNVKLTNGGGANSGVTNDVFLAKYDPLGNVIWAKNFGSSQDEFAYGVVADAKSNIYMTGCFNGPSITIGSTTLTNTMANYYDVFISKFDSSGNVLWAKSMGGTSNENSAGLSTDLHDNLFVTGMFESPTIKLGNISLTNEGGTDIFIAKYDSDGNVKWAKKGSGTDFENPYSITADTTGNSYITGRFESATIQFGNKTLVKEATVGTSDLFITKYDPNGNVKWAKSVGGSNYEEGMGIAADNFSHVYVSGSFQSSSINFANTILNNANSGTSDIFIAKYDSSGNVLWAKRSGGVNQEIGSGLITNPKGEVFLTGRFQGSTLSLGSTILTNQGRVNSLDFFVSKLDSSGNVLWAKSAGVYDNDYAFAAVDQSDHVYLGGYYWGYPITLGSTVLTNNGSFDIFLTKLSIDDIVLNSSGSWSEKTIEVFPNPSSEEINILSSSSIQFETIRIFNIQGEVIWEKLNEHDDTVTFDISNLKSGVYYIELSNDSEITRTGFVKN